MVIMKCWGHEDSPNPFLNRFPLSPGWWTRCGLLITHCVLLLWIGCTRGTCVDRVSAVGVVLCVLTWWAYRRAIQDPGFILPASDSSMMVAGDGKCQVCRIQPPLRSKHCSKCGRCVDRYDHHCSILAVCVGSKNHAAFWDYLLIESGLCLYFLVILVHETVFEVRHSWLLSIPLLLVLISCSAIPTVLLIQHSFLAMTNQTSWEFYRRDRIHYLAHLDEHVMPFDQGCWQNTLFFCFTMRRGHTRPWLLPAAPIMLSKQKKGTCWNNKHYSCC